MVSRVQYIRCPDISLGKGHAPAFLGMREHRKLSASLSPLRLESREGGAKLEPSSASWIPISEGYIGSTDSNPLWSK